MEQLYESTQSAPYLPTKRVTLEIPRDAGPVDLSTVQLRGELQVTGGLDLSGNNLIARAYLEDGVAALICEVRVLDASGRVVEHVRYQDVLKSLRTDWCVNSSTTVRRENTSLSGQSLAVVGDTDDAVFPDAMQFKIPLHELSLGTAALDFWDRGYKLELVLNNSRRPFRQMITSEDFESEDKSA